MISSRPISSAPISGRSSPGITIPVTPPAPSQRATVLVNGVMTTISTGQLGTGLKPIVYVNGRFRLRAGSEGIPVVKVGSRYRLLGAGETLES